MHLSLIMLTLAIVSTHAGIPKDMNDMRDNKVKACTDFYQHACGGWLKKHRLSSTQSFIDSSITEIREDNGDVFMDIIEKKYETIDPLWESCMAVKMINALDTEPLKVDLEKIVSADSMKRIFMLAGEFSRTGTHAITMYSVEPDMEAELNTLLLHPADLPLPHLVMKDLHSLKLKKGYKTYIKKLIKVSGFTLPGEDRSRPMEDIIVEIEKKLTDIYTIEETNPNDMQEMEIKAAENRWPMTVDAYLEGLRGKRTNLVSSIVMQRTDYFDEVEKMIKEYALNDFKVYLAFAMVHSRVEWLGTKFFKVWFEFFGKTMNGQTKAPDRKSICVSKVVQYLPDLMGKYYNPRAFNTLLHSSALHMTKLINETMQEHIAHSDWLTPDEKNVAQSKLKEVIYFVGKSPEPPTYPSTLSPRNFPANVHTILLNAFEDEMTKVGRRVNRTVWPTSSATMNAHYSLRKNTMVFPAAILQPPLFNGRKFHPARNFGGIGYIMGRELTHGFDTMGRLYDENGKRREWWSEENLGYNTRAQCIKGQYSRVQVQVKSKVIGNVDGELTLNENIADIRGVALAWDAYKKFMKEDEAKIHSEISEPDGDMMFFLAFAQTWCRKTRVQTMTRELTTVPHSLGQWRVNGVVKNNRDFANAFGCNDISPMNPEDQCQPW